MEQDVRSRKTWIVLAVVAAAVVAVAVVGFARAAGPSNPEPQESVFTLRGSLTLKGGYDELGFAGGYANVKAGDLCFGQGGYDDIGAGTSVNVYAPDGTVVAHGMLNAGRATNATRNAEGAIGLTDCAFDFAVDGVPGGQEVYLVEVAHRGRVSFGPDVQTTSVKVTLG